MKKTHLTLILVGVLLLNACNTPKQSPKNSDSPLDSNRDKEASYFGEEPPGLIPKLFDPAIVSSEGLFEEGRFSPDGKSYYFNRSNGKYKERTFFVIQYDGQNSKAWAPHLRINISWAYLFQTMELLTLMNWLHQIQLEQSVIHAL